MAVHIGSDGYGIDTLKSRYAALHEAITSDLIASFLSRREVFVRREHVPAPMCEKISNFAAIFLRSVFLQAGMA